MKKPLKFGIAMIGFLVLLFVGLSIFLKIFLSSDRLKAMILPRAESMTGRKVSLDQINVSLFKGIVAKGLSVKEKDGEKDFLRIGEFILSYRFWPLLKRELVIDKIEIGSAFVSVKKYKGEKYNFSDLLDKERRPPVPSKPQERTPQGLPVSLIADKLLIRNAQFAFVDEEKALPDISGSLDSEFKGGIGKEGLPRLERGLISLKEIKIKMRDIEVKATGKVEIDPKVVQANLETFIGKENLEITATIKDYMSAPDVTGNIHAKSLDLESLIAMVGEKKAPEGRQGTTKAGEGVLPREQRAGKATESPAQKIKASGRITVDEARYQEYRIKDLRLDYSYGRGILKLEPFGMKFSGGNAFTMEGVLDGNLQLAVDQPSNIQKSLKGKAVVKLGKGQIKESKIFDAISLLVGLPELKKPEIDEGLLNFDIKDEKVNLDGLIQSSVFKLAPKGVVDFEKRLDVLPGLKISPNLTGRLSKSLASFKFMEDEQGWKTIPIKIKGTTEKPNVTLDEEALKKQLGTGLKKAFEKLLQRPGPEEEGKPTQKVRPKDLLKEMFGK
ncbi:MAG: AsmA family protein [Thermodesulfobacteriota bacterium]